MLYNPPAFKVDDRDVLFDQIEQLNFAMLATTSADGPVVSHAPVLLDRSKGANGTLIGHLAKANPHWQQYDPDTTALAVFQGAHGYVTPSWYPSKQEHGRVVPTWNYAVVHARGWLTFFEDTDRLRGIVEGLTDRHEAGRAEPWALSDAPEKFIDAQLRGIVGFELAIETLEGKHKLSQNRLPADREGVIAGLAEQDGPASAAMRELVAEAHAKLPQS